MIAWWKTWCAAIGGQQLATAFLFGLVAMAVMSGMTALGTSLEARYGRAVTISASR